jgi:hypothetical protein
VLATVLPGVENSLEGSRISRENRCFCCDAPEPNDLPIRAPPYGLPQFVGTSALDRYRMGLIACSYRAAESRHKEIELTADELLQYLDTKSERRRKR